MRRFQNQQKKTLTAKNVVAINFSPIWFDKSFREKVNPHKKAPGLRFAPTF